MKQPCSHDDCPNVLDFTVLLDGSFTCECGAVITTCTGGFAPGDPGREITFYRPLFFKQTTPPMFILNPRGGSIVGADLRGPLPKSIAAVKPT